MALKNFDEMYRLDISDLTKKVDGFDYLSWLDCEMSLRAAGAEHISYDCKKVIWTPGGKYALVKVWVKIDGIKHSITHPVANGDTAIENPTSSQIAFAIQRAFVKCVAIFWGLGLSLWKGVDTDVVSSPKDTSLAIKIPIEFGKAVPHLGTADEVHERIGTTKASLSKVISEGTDAERQEILAKILEITTAF